MCIGKNIYICIGKFYLLLNIYFYIMVVSVLIFVYFLIPTLKFHASKEIVRKKIIYTETGRLGIAL